jgi:hypothetical protein
MSEQIHHYTPIPSSTYSSGKRLYHQRHLQTRLFFSLYSRPHNNTIISVVPSILTPIAIGHATYSDFFSNSGFEANCSNVKFLSSTNNIALISTKANLYPIQFRGPPRKVSILPYTPGTELRASCCSFVGVRAYRSGLNVSASGPQTSVEALMLWIAIVSEA